MSPAGAILADLVKRFRPEAAQGLHAVYQLHLTGDGGDFWHVSVADQQCRLSPGPAAEPDVAITMSVQDWGELAAGRLDPITAFMSGRVQILGDFGLAARLRGIFGL